MFSKFKPSFVDKGNLHCFSKNISSSSSCNLDRGQRLLSAQTAPPPCLFSPLSSSYVFACRCHGHRIKGQIRGGHTITCLKHHSGLVIKRCPVFISCPLHLLSAPLLILKQLDVWRALVSPWSWCRTTKLFFLTDAMVDWKIVGKYWCSWSNYWINALLCSLWVVPQEHSHEVLQYGIFIVGVLFISTNTPTKWKQPISKDIQRL